MTSAKLPDQRAIADWLARNAANWPDRTFVHSIEQEKSITAQEMFRLSNRIGHYLAAKNIGPNDRVALLSHNSLEHLAVYLGVMAHGATICTIHVEMNAPHMGDILNAVRPKLIILESGIEVDISSAAGDAEIIDLGVWRQGADQKSEGLFAALSKYPETAPAGAGHAATDIASIFYTSGTTSKPKGILCRFQDLAENVLGVCDAFGLKDDDIILDFRSFNWMSAQTLSGLGALSSGATLILARKFSRRRFFGWIKDFGVTVAAGNPTIINMFIQKPEAVDRSALTSLRFITSSSAPLLVRDWKKFEAMYDIPIVQGYGSSETGWIAGADETNRRLGSAGKPLAYQNVRIVDHEGRELPPGDTGEIELGPRDESIFQYLGDDGSIVVNARGRIRTGDIGNLDADGYLYVTGRVKDLIIRGGVNISPAEIDNFIGQLADIAEVVTVGVPDTIYGEEVIAFVVRANRAGIGEADVLKFCAESLPEAKMPKLIIFRDDLPKTKRGKIDRKLLVAEWAELKAASYTNLHK